MNLEVNKMIKNWNKQSI